MPNVSDKRVQTLTQAAGSTPQLQTGASSLAGDLVNAASFGLQTYQRYQAQDELNQLTARERQFESAVNKGAADFERLQREIEASGVSGVRANSQINKFLQGIGDDGLRNAILEKSKKLSGVSALGVVSDAEQEALAIRQETDDLRVQAAGLVGYSTQPRIDFQSADPDQLRSYIIDATANKAAADKAMLDYENNSRAVAAQESRSLKLGGIQYNAIALNTTVAQAREIVRGVNLQDPASRTQALELIRTLKQNMPVDFQQYMNEALNVPVSSSQASETLAPITAMLDSLMDDVMGTDAVQLQANTLEQLTQGMILTANQKDPASVRKYLLAKNLNFPLAGRTDAAYAAILEATGDLETKSTSVVVDELRQSQIASGVPEQEVEKHVKMVRDMAAGASNNYKELTDADRAGLTNNLLQDINPSSQADLIRSLHDGTLTMRVKELANPESAQAYMGSSQEVGDALKRSTDLVVSRLGTQFFTQRTAGALSTLGGRGSTQSLGNFYKFDPAQSQFVLRNPNVRAVQNADTVRGLNSYISNVIKAYNNLGLPDQEQNLKQELAELFGEADAGQRSDEEERN